MRAFLVPARRGRDGRAAARCQGVVHHRTCHRATDQRVDEDGTGRCVFMVRDGSKTAAAHSTARNASVHVGLCGCLRPRLHAPPRSVAAPAAPAMTPANSLLRRSRRAFPARPLPPHPRSEFRVVVRSAGKGRLPVGLFRRWGAGGAALVAQGAARGTGAGLRMPRRAAWTSWAGWGWGRRPWRRPPASGLRLYTCIYVTSYELRLHVYMCSTTSYRVTENDAFHPQEIRGLVYKKH